MIGGICELCKTMRAGLTSRVPAADAKISQQAMDETFYLSNIAPQVGDGFNRHCELSSASFGADGKLTRRLGIRGGLLPSADDQL